MPFPRELLTDDETLVLDLRPHWWYIAPASVYLAIALILGIFAWAGEWWEPLQFLIGIAVLIALGYFAIRYGRWATTNFVVTSERVISRSGVVAKRGIEIPLERINTVFFNQSLFERLIGAGDLGIESAGEGGRQTFSDIRKPSIVQAEIYRQKEAVEQRRLQQLGSTLAAQFPVQPVPPSAPSMSIPEQIEHLDRLRRSGAITEAEFQAKKQELLRRM
ncbi:MAG TPA: PH domain-containing protein [Acidimicrobiales bacterium]